MNAVFYCISFVPKNGRNRRSAGTVTRQSQMKRKRKRKILESATTTPSQNINVTVRSCARAMKRDFEKRFGYLTVEVFSRSIVRGAANRQVGIHPAYMFAHALDPRFKDLRFIENETSCDALWKEILEAIVALAKDKAKVVGTENIEEDEDGDAGSKGSKSKNDKGKTISSLGKFMKKRMIRKGDNPNQQVSNTAIRAALRYELSMYRAAPIDISEDILQYLEDTNPLDWWKKNHQNYPNVWALAKQFLPVPATSAPSERAFSAAGNVVTLRRCSLNVDLVDDIVLLRENIDRVREIFD